MHGIRAQSVNGMNSARKEMHVDANDEGTGDVQGKHADNGAG
ncbi:hypothetical protein HMPREF0762_00524 [Slackia exigua ATCC 700122]|uniref:Uncharacterized protein n=1 Tax=Slackia exigua (strain ATCC 700122 / DSM 15923 / CIP 105133 / JCM 11022 / KCTC 5966 / S-7) TaxID=649764 RepID=D0WF18_SLAES|nr:hypothetical protein HMPREF0762_00524 [Slackia exigua ATCC 700122]